MFSHRRCRVLLLHLTVTPQRLVQRLPEFKPFSQQRPYFEKLNSESDMLDSVSNAPKNVRRNDFCGGFLLWGPLRNYWHPFGVLDTGWNTKCCSWQSKEGRLKKERKREKVGLLSLTTETRAIWDWAMVESRGQLHLFNQSINDCNERINHQPTKKRSLIGSYQHRTVFIQLHKIE